MVSGVSLASRFAQWIRLDRHEMPKMWVYVFRRMGGLGVMTEPTNAEISAAAEAVIKYMLSHEAKDRPPTVTAIYIARAALTAAA